MIKSILIAGAGGFLGTCLRFLAGRLATALGAGIFPWGTLSVNLAGSFLIGILFGLAERGNMISPQMNLLLITGFCGGLTTFSSMSHDMLTLIQDRHFAYFAAYTGASFIFGLLLVWLGRAIVVRA